MQGEKALFSSESVEWGTPQQLYDWLDKRYHFKLDACASDNNHKNDCYFTEENNALSREWGVAGDSAFMNPPYAKREVACKPNCTKLKCKKRGYHIDKDIPGIGDFIAKAYLEATRGIDVICLIPNRSDTQWFEKYVTKADEVYQIGGRLHFIDYSDPTNKEGEHGKTSPSTFPSIIVCFHGTQWVQGKKHDRPKYYYTVIDKNTNEITVI